MELFSPFEKRLNSIKQFELAHLCQFLRTNSPYSEDPYSKIWEEQAQFNLPILITASVFLDKFCKNRGFQKILFTSRDSCLWVQIFKKLFPQYDAVYFHASRYTYYNPSDSYISYVKGEYTANTLIVDVHGKGNSCSHFFSKYLGVIPHYLAIVNSGKNHHAIIRRKEVAEKIEATNYDVTGALYDVVEGTAMRAPLEYPLEYIKPIHECLALCIEIMGTKWEPYDLRVLSWAIQEIEKSSAIGQTISYAKWHHHALQDGKMTHLHIQIPN